MDQRFTLALAVLVLVGGALALWLMPQQQTIAPVEPDVISAEPAPPPAREQSYVLAISWHPAFCESKPGLPECRDERPGDYAADHFALHGLWPEDEYCGVDERLIAIDGANRWSELPSIDVSPTTWRDLQRVMPGTRDQLERHEWIFHGTCSGATTDTYFRRAIALLEVVNASPVRELFARNIGSQLSRNEIRGAFNSAFGANAGRKVRIDCDDPDGRDLITELRINLDGDVLGNAKLPALLSAARNASAGCPLGIVDEVG